jgi:hypothetical protein
VSALALGSPVTITARSEGRAGTAQVTLIPPPVASVTVTPPADTILVGETVQLAVTLRDAAGAPLTGRTVTWTSSTSTIASVSSSGLVTGSAIGGPVTITARSEGVTGTASITVTGTPHACLVSNLAALAVGETASGALQASDCRDPSGRFGDGYRFVLDAASTVRLDLSSAAFDAFLRLGDASGVVIATDDDSGPGAAAQILRSLPAGAYTVLATSFGAGSTGAYSLTLTGVSAAGLDAAASTTLGGAQSIAAIPRKR